jgi:NTP pyrophosphatase (non-canonical NTP hydrolase)
MKMTLNELRDAAHKNAVNKGFYDFETSAPNGALVDEVKHAFFAQKIALIHSEASEALEAHRDGRWASHLAFDFDPESKDYAFSAHIKNSVEAELADIIIRVLDLCGHMKIDIETHVRLKMGYNSTRGNKHGKSY